MPSWWSSKRGRPAEPKNPAELLSARFPLSVQLHADDNPFRTNDLATHIAHFPVNGRVRYRSRTADSQKVPDAVQRAVDDIVRSSSAVGFPVRRDLKGMKQTREFIDAIDKMEKKHGVTLVPTIHLRENPLSPEECTLEVRLHLPDILRANTLLPLKKAVEVLSDLHLLLKPTTPPRR